MNSLGLLTQTVMTLNLSFIFIFFLHFGFISVSKCLISDGFVFKYI